MCNLGKQGSPKQASGLAGWLVALCSATRSFAGLAPESGGGAAAGLPLLSGLGASSRGGAPGGATWTSRMPGCSTSQPARLPGPGESSCWGAPFLPAAAAAALPFLPFRFFGSGPPRGEAAVAAARRGSLMSSAAALAAPTPAAESSSSRRRKVSPRLASPLSHWLLLAPIARRAAAGRTRAGEWLPGFCFARGGGWRAEERRSSSSRRGGAFCPPQAPIHRRGREEPRLATPRGHHEEAVGMWAGEEERQLALEPEPPRSPP